MSSLPRTQVLIRVTAPVRQELELIAASERRSLSALISGILLDWLEAKEVEQNRAA